MIREAIILSGFLCSRHSYPVGGPLSYSVAIELAELLDRAYNGELDPIPLNPFAEEAATSKVIACIKMSLKDLFPLTP